MSSIDYLEKMEELLFSFDYVNKREVKHGNNKKLAELKYSL